MRNRVLILSLFAALLAAASCGGGAAGSEAEAPELLQAVPSDALCVGVFSRCDHALQRMTDSVSVFRKLDYGKLSRSRCAFALCDVGSISGLLVLDAGKHGADTLEAASSLLAQADSLKLSAALVELGARDALLLSPSATVITVARRHLASESSVLDAPQFDGVLQHLGGADAIAFRNSGAPKLFNVPLPGIARKEVASFVKEACVWVVAEGDRLYFVQPSGERYFCNFFDGVEDGASKLQASFPEGADLVIDIPVSSLPDYRRSYETWLDAGVVLEAYQKRLQALKKAAGKDPLAWEKEVGVRELASVSFRGSRLNMVRTDKTAATDGVVRNPYTGFVNALYGSVFNPADSCMLRSGNWIISGERAALDSLRLEKCQGWPARARAVVSTPEKRMTWTKESVRIWDSNR